MHARGRENSPMNLFPLLVSCSLCLATTPERAPAEPWNVKPYRALVVVERWNDPASVLVDHEKDHFQPEAALLKAWTVPFDIFRLDQQHLDASYLFDRSGKVRYGVVIWLADSPSYEGQNLASLEEAARGGTGLIVVASRFLDPALERLLGLKFKEAYRAPDPLRVARPHFITWELAVQKMDPLDVSEESSNRLWVQPQGAEVLISQGQHPLLTVNQVERDVSGVWIGAPHLAAPRDSAYWRSLLFRSLLWTLGCVVQPNVDYAHRVEIEIDDWGTSDKGFLSYWRYLEPREETLREHLIAPLEKRHAVVAANVITGYVDRKSGRIVSPWTQHFRDSYGLPQDFASTQRGLKAAVAAGVLEIQSHGWTHMQPDLDSPPGPWWTADLAGEASAGGWYKEFGDERRGIEIPAIVQLWHMKRSMEYLEEDFGQQPLELRPGGGAWSKSDANQTGRVAAQAGFGIFHAEPSFYYYLDRDLVLDMTGIAPHTLASYDRPLHAESWPPHSDGPLMLVFHDRDIALQPDFVERLFAALPASYETLSTNQYVAFLHAHVESQAADGLQLKFVFDAPYCAYFRDHSSSWRFWVSESLRKKLRGFHRLVVNVDGKPTETVVPGDLLGESLTMDVPAGLGEHVWSLTPAN
jgi:hypothetical protein